MKISLLLSLLFIFVGCAVAPEIDEAKSLQLSLVDDLNSNYQATCKETIALYQQQSTSDQEFIFELLKKEDVARASELLKKKLAIIQDNLNRLRERLEANQANYEQFKRLWEALR